MGSAAERGCIAGFLLAIFIVGTPRVAHTFARKTTMVIDLPHFGKCDGERLGRFVSFMESEFERAVELKKSYGLINDALSKEEGLSTGTFIAYSTAAEQAYNVQMLQLRDRILNEIREFTANSKSL